MNKEDKLQQLSPKSEPEDLNVSMQKSDVSPNSRIIVVSLTFDFTLEIDVVLIELFFSLKKTAVNRILLCHCHALLLTLKVKYNT